MRPSLSMAMPPHEHWNCAFPAPALPITNTRAVAVAHATIAVFNNTNFEKDITRARGCAQYMCAYTRGKIAVNYNRQH